MLAKLKTKWADLRKFEEVTEVLGNTDGRLVAIVDNVGNISNHLKAIENWQKTDNVNLKAAVENRSKVLEEKDFDKVLQLGNEVAGLRSDFKESQDLKEKSLKKSQDLEEKLTYIISQLEGDLRKSQDLGEKLASTVSLRRGDQMTKKSRIKKI